MSVCIDHADLVRRFEACDINPQRSAMPSISTSPSVF